LNVTEISRRLGIPQSTATTKLIILEEAGLVDSHTVNGVKGGQKICTARYKGFLVTFNPPNLPIENNLIEVEMPVGLFTSFDISAPCGLCSRDSIIGYLDVHGTFFSPDRIKAALVWFGKDYVEYKFPNNALYLLKESVPAPEPEDKEGWAKRIGLSTTEVREYSRQGCVNSTEDVLKRWNSAKTPI